MEQGTLKPYPANPDSDNKISEIQENVTLLAELFFFLSKNMKRKKTYKPLQPLDSLSMAPTNEMLHWCNIFKSNFRKIKGDTQETRR